MCILYHISMDDRFKSMFADTDCIPQVRLANVRYRQTQADTLASAAHGTREFNAWESEGEEGTRTTSGTINPPRVFGLTVTTPLFFLLSISCHFILFLNLPPHIRLLISIAKLAQ